MIELRPFSQLNPDDVAQQHAEALQRVQEDNPKLDLRRGVFADLLIYYHSILAGQGQMNIKDYWRARSLQAMEADPDLATADPDLVGDVISNFNVARQPGAKATGEVTIVVTDSITVTIGIGAVFEAQGLRFITTRVFTGKTSGRIDDPGDRLLTQTADGNWAFTIEVQAEQEGEQYQIKKDTLIVPLVLPLNYRTSFAANDFEGGYQAETNQDLLLRLQEGVAARGLGGRINQTATLRAVEDFSRVIAVSVVGYGDAEMLRDKHWVFPISGGGRVDWYVRSQEEVFRKKLLKEATLISKTDSGVGTWQVSIGRDEAPGYYEIDNIRPKDSGNAVGGFEILTDERVADLTGPGFVPDVLADSDEWVYTRFQAGVVQFVDTVQSAAALALGAKREYELEARCLPLVAEIQDTFSTPDSRPKPYDLLVKAPVPCFLNLTFTVYKRSGEADPDLAAMKTALCTEVNSVGFIGRLFASQLHDVIHAYLRNDQTASAIDMFGRIRYPSGEPEYVRDSEKLEVPDDPVALVSARTVQFFISPEDISISVETSVPSSL